MKVVGVVRIVSKMCTQGKKIKNFISPFFYRIFDLLILIL